MGDKCLNLANPVLRELAKIHGEIVVSKFIDKKYPDGFISDNPIRDIALKYKMDDFGFFTTNVDIKELKKEATFVGYELKKNSNGKYSLSKNGNNYIPFLDETEKELEDFEILNVGIEEYKIQLERKQKFTKDKKSKSTNDVTQLTLFSANNKISDISLEDNSAIMKLIEQEVLKVESILPQEIQIIIDNDYKQVLSQGRIAAGFFRNNMITLTSDALSGTVYHEAFHAVFRTMLSTNEQSLIIKSAMKSMVKPLETDIEFLMETHDVSREEAINIAYEEMLADDFSMYLKHHENYDFSQEIASPILKFFNRLLVWIKKVFNNKITIDQLFSDIATGKFKSSKPNVTRASIKPVFSARHPNFTSYEVQEFTASFVHAIFENIVQLKDLKNISSYDMFMKIVPTIIETRKYVEENYPEQLKQSLLDKLDNLITDDGNLDKFWEERIKSYIKTNLKLTSIKDKKEMLSEEDADVQEQQESSVDFKERWRSSDKDNATGNIKFITSMIPKVKLVYDSEGNATFKKIRNEVTGMYSFHSQQYIDGNLKPLLEGIATINRNNSSVDVFTLMMEKLATVIKKKPELYYLKNILESSDKQTKTQFVQAYQLQRKGLLTVLTSGSPMDENGNGGISTTIIASSENTRENSYFETWAANFYKNFGVFNGNKFVYSRVKIDNFLKIKDEFQAALNYNKTNYSTDNKGNIVPNKDVVDSLNNMLTLLGVNISPQALRDVLEEELDNDLKNIDKNSSVKQQIEKAIQPIAQLFDKLLYVNYNNALVDAVDKPLTKETNLFLDQSSTFKGILARKEAFYNPIQGENMVNGVNGKVWTYQTHDFKSMVLNAIKNNDISFLLDLKNSIYHRHSQLLNMLLSENEVEGVKSYTINKEVADKIVFTAYNNHQILGDSTTASKAKDLKAPDKLLDVFTKYMNKYFVGLAEADKTMQSYITYPKIFKSGYNYNPETKNVTVDNKEDTVLVLSKYLFAELERMRQVYNDTRDKDGNFTQDGTGLVPNFHYFEDKNGKLHPGAGFNSFIFPEIDLASLGLLDDKGRVKNLTSYNDIIDNPKIRQYIVTSFTKEVSVTVKEFLRLGLISKKDGIYLNRVLPTDIVDNYGNVANAIADFTLNSIIATIEETMLFNGDPAYYTVKEVFNKKEVEKEGVKSTEYSLKPWKEAILYGDFMKRIPAVNAFGNAPRIFEDVNPYYSSATINNIKNSSSYFFTKDDKGNTVYNEEVVEAIANNAKLTIAEIKNILKEYKDINVTDAQAYITLDLYRQRMKSFGKWNDATHEVVYQKIMDNEERYLKGEPEELLSANELSLMAQPLKVVHFQLIKEGKYLIPVYNKQSEAVLLPNLTRGLELDNIRIAMENSNLDHVIVGDGRKVGTIDVANVTDENGNILSLEALEAEFSDKYIMLETKYALLQVNLDAHGVGNTLDSTQKVKNILGTVDLTEMYSDGVEGVEFVAKIERAKALLSDIGHENFKKNIGYSDKGGFEKEDGVFKIIKQIAEENEGKIFDNHLDYIEKGLDVDALSIINSIETSVASMNTKYTVKLKQLGGGYIQMSNFGLIGKETSLSKDMINNGIVWLKNPKEQLQPMRAVKDGKSKPAQVLLSHDKLMKILEELDIDYKNMSSKEFKKLIGTRIPKDILKGISARIPNQGAASNDAFDIVGFLPPEVGDVIVMYSDITTKTGSDFDIDKAYIVLPEFNYNKDTGKIYMYKYDESKNQDLNAQEKGLNNMSLFLMREVLLHPSAYIKVMSPLDAPELKDLATKLFPEKKVNSNLRFWNGLTQLANKALFDDAKTLVGVIATHMTSSNLFKAHAISYDGYYFGMGNKDAQGNTLLDRNLQGVPVGDDGKDISIVLGMYMNAIVDAVKDPFISRANVNLKTANLTFTLIRAGFSLDWVVSFIGQPIIKDYLSLQETSESNYGVKKNADAILTEVANKYNLASSGINRAYLLKYEKNATLKVNGQITTTAQELNSMLNKTASELDNIQQLKQLKILGQFLQWQKKAGEFSELISLTRVDVQGTGKSIQEAQLTKNLFEKIKKEHKFNNIEDLLGYRIETHQTIFTGKEINGKYYKSLIGTFYQNAIEKPIDMFKNFFLSTTSAFTQSLNNIAARQGYVYLTPDNSELVYNIRSVLRGAVISDTDFLRQSKEELANLFFGNKEIEGDLVDSRKLSMTSRLQEAQKNPKISNNLLISQNTGLMLRQTKGTSLLRIFMDNNENTKEIGGDFAIAWEELFKEVPNFAKDLILYSFYTTSFSSASGSFFKYIPYLGEESNKYSNDLQIIKKIAAREANTFGKFEDTVVKNLYDNDTLVPVVKKRMELKSDALKGKIPLSSAFVLTEDEDNKNYIAGRDAENQIVYKRFVKYRQYNPEGMLVGTLLYQLFGYSADGQKAIYLKTNKLGNSFGTKIYEFTDTNSESIINSNSIFSEEELVALEVIREFKGDLEFANHTPVMRKEESVYSENPNKPTKEEVIANLKYCLNL